MSAPAILDQAHFDHMTGGDAALQEEIVGLFRGQVDAWSRKLTPDEPGWRDVAHTLKGSARGVGLWALADACERAESANDNEVRPALSAVHQALADALAALAGDAPR